ncbi:MAG: hemolysin family protein [Anaerolineae bacterium]|jgi:CBS domain containing-hemolysin-like protein
MPAGIVILRLASALALVALNGYFVAVEFAVVAVRRTRIDDLIAQGDGTARVAQRLVENPDRVIAASQLGITMASLALGWIGEATVAAVIEPLLEATLGQWSETAAHSIGLVVAFSLVTFTHIVLGEQVPKTISIRYAERATLAIARPMMLFLRIFRPLIGILDGATAAFLRLLGMEPIAGHQTVYTLEELKLIVRESQASGTIEAAQEVMLQRVFRFGDRQVHEAMIPRPDVIGVEADAPLQSLLDIFSEHSHARFPVCEDDLDNIVGMVAIKDVLRALADGCDRISTPVRALARPAHFVPETAPVADLFTEMRSTHNQMAVVIDEYGGTAGIVTLEELVEEIVGQLSDELVAEEEQVVELEDGSVKVDAQLRVDEVNEHLTLALPEGEDYETVAGLVLYYLQRVPVEGDVLRHAGLELEVVQMKGPKIEVVRIVRA